MDKEFKNGRTIVDAEYIEMVINNFNYTISKNMETVYLGYEIIDDQDIKEYRIPKKDWIKTLNLFLKNAIEIEEYGSCTLLKNLISSLK